MTEETKPSDEDIKSFTAILLEKMQHAHGLYMLMKFVGANLPTLMMLTASGDARALALLTVTCSSLEKSLGEAMKDGGLSADDLLEAIDHPDALVDYIKTMIETPEGGMQ
jgi:hypothetical protein